MWGWQEGRERTAQNRHGTHPDVALSAVNDEGPREWLWRWGGGEPARACFPPDRLSYLPQTRACAWRAGAARARAGSRSGTRACGARCATTTGASRTPASCAASWAAAPRWGPRGAAASARARDPSCWTTCAARAPRMLWSAAPTWAGLNTTASTGRTRAWSVQVPSPRPAAQRRARPAVFPRHSSGQIHHRRQCEDGEAPDSGITRGYLLHKCRRKCFNRTGSGF